MRITLITGSRADRGALEVVATALSNYDHDVFWCVLNTRTALSRWQASANATYASEHTRLRLGGECAELAIIHGDRHEILGAAVAANVCGVPIAHLGGGDLTEGSQDDCFRHAITKLSHLHFATCEESADRIIQMGEQPDRVHVTGDPGIDRVMATKLLGRDETFAAVGLATPQRCLLVSFHPNTLGDTRDELGPLSDALIGAVSQGISVVFIGPNADADGDLIRKQWKSIVFTNKKDAGMPQLTVYHENLPGQVYLSLMRWCDVMVGNSSAGYYEAPCFPIRVVDIGDRQKGRRWHERLASIRPEDINPSYIGAVIDYQMKRCAVGNMTFINPYGDGHAAGRIAKIIDEIKNPKWLLRKQFHHIEPKEEEGDWRLRSGNS